MTSDPQAVAQASPTSNSGAAHPHDAFEFSSTRRGRRPGSRPRAVHAPDGVDPLDLVEEVRDGAGVSGAQARGPGGS